MALNGQHLGTGDHLETRPLFSPPPKKHVQQKRTDGNTLSPKTHPKMCWDLLRWICLGGLKLDWNLWLERRQTCRKFGTTSTDFHLPIVFLCQWMKHPSHQLGDGEKYDFKNTHNEPKSYVYIWLYNIYKNRSDSFNYVWLEMPGFHI